MAFEDFGYPSPVGPAETSRGTEPFRLTPIQGVQNIGGNPPSVRMPYIPEAQADKTWGTLFKGLTSLGENAATGLDTMYKKEIDKAVNTQARAITDKYIAEGQDQISLLEGSQPPTQDQKSGGAQPAGLAQGLSRMDQIKQALESSPERALRYHTDLDVLVRGLRSQYPGYQDAIDSKIREVTGVDPANARWRDIQTRIHDLNTLKQAQANKDEQWLQSNSGYLWQAPGQPDVNKLTIPEMKALVWQRKAQEGKWKFDEARATADDRAGKLQTENIRQSAYEQAQAITNKHWGAFLQSIPPEAMDRFNRGIATPEEIAGIGRSVLGVKAAIQQEMGVAFNKPFADDPSLSWNYLLSKAGKDTVKDIQDQVLAPLDAIMAASVGKETNVMQIAKKQLEAENSENTLRVAKELPEGRNIMGLRGLFGDQALAPIAASKAPAILEYLNRRNLVAAGTSAEPLSQTMDTMKRVSGKDGNAAAGSAAAMNDTINLRVSTMVNDKTPIETRAKLAKSIYEDPNSVALINRFSPDDRIKFFTSLANQKTLDTMKQLEAQGASGAVAAYTNWSKSAFVEAARGQTDNLKNDLPANPYVELTVLPSGRLDFVPTPDGQQQIIKNRMGSDWKPGLINPADLQAVDKINALLAGVTPALKEGGQTTEDFLREAVPQMGLTPEQLQKGGLWFQFNKAAGDPLGLLQEGTKQVGKAVSGIINNPNPREYNPLDYTPTQNQREQGQSQAPLSLEERLKAMGIADSKIAGMIRQAEASGSYNKLVYQNKDVDVTGRTVDEVMALQRMYLDRQHANPVKGRDPASAIGAYQFNLQSMKELKKEMGLTGDEVMTPELQDRMFLHTLKKRGYDKWKEGKMTNQQFVQSLSQEWAGLPSLSGKSFYEGVGNNHANVRLPDVFAALPDLRSYAGREE